jgi:hypothetical protein
MKWTVFWFSVSTFSGKFERVYQDFDENSYGAAERVARIKPGAVLDLIANCPWHHSHTGVKVRYRIIQTESPAGGFTVKRWSGKGWRFVKWFEHHPAAAVWVSQQSASVLEDASK